MAKDSAKKTYEDNKKILRNLRVLLILALSASFVFRFVLFRKTVTKGHIFAYTFTNILIGVAYYIISNSAKVQIHENKLIDGGISLRNPGVISYCFDIVYICSFILVTTAIISDYFWMFYLLIVGYCVYQLVLRLTSSANTPEPIESNTQRKKRERYEKQQGMLGKSKQL